MAGGPYAHFVPCMQCLARAERTHEGQEDDLYLCEAGHKFGVDWSHGGPPAKSPWPPSEEERALFQKIQKLRGGG